MWPAKSLPVRLCQDELEEAGIGVTKHITGTGVVMHSLPIRSEAYVCERQFVDAVKSDLGLVAGQKAVSCVDWH